MKCKLTLITAAVIAVSCSSNSSSKNASDSEASKQQQHNMPLPLPEKKFAGVIFANEKDYICGMPVTAGVDDTAHYKNKVYGFCAKECKDEFLKNPEAHLAAK